MDNSKLLGDIKQFNDRLKKVTELENQMKAKVEYSTNEFNRLSAEVSAEMGVAITPENVESIYNNLVSQLEESIANGNQIFDRIDAQMNGVEQVSNQQQAVVQQMPVQNNFMQLGQPNGNVVGNGGAVNMNGMPGMTNAPLQQNVYGGVVAGQGQPQQTGMFFGATSQYDGQAVIGLQNFGAEDNSDNSMLMTGFNGASGIQI